MRAFIKAGTFLVSMFVIGLAIIIGARLDQLTISLLGGVIVGVAIATPIVILVTFLALHQAKTNALINNSTQQHLSSATPATPPQIIFLPSPSNYQSPASPRVNPSSIQPHADPLFMPMRRHFYVIGGSGEVTEINPSDDTQQTAFPKNPQDHQQQLY